MLARGADIAEFWKSWPPGPNVTVDECCVDEDLSGELIYCPNGDGVGARIDPAQMYEFDGYLDWDSRLPMPARFNHSLEEVFAEWLASRTTVTLVVELPRNDTVEAALRAEVARLGGRVVS